MILEKLNLPDDIKGLSNEALYTLANEVRDRIDRKSVV